jgi:exodeoxyribonuclease V alpha subunit
MLGMGRAGRETPCSLAADVVVVDEASMVDLSLMVKLMEAVPEHARLILLGDKDQLASVEAGAILGDICKGGETQNGEGIGKSIIQLTRNYRFDASAGIGRLAAAIRDGDSQGAVACLENGGLAGVTFIQARETDLLPGVLSGIVRKEYLPCFFEGEPRQRWERFSAFRILCAHRQGALGVAGVNEWVERFLLHEAGLEPGRTWYSGRPVMVEQNDYQLGLFNGDVGVTAPTGPLDEDVGVFFPDVGAEGRFLMPSRLPRHTTVYAMTVHKSQGSEFDRIVLVLPPRRSPVVTRELLYTAVTRARSHVTILGDLQMVRETVDTPVQRASGLSEQLQAISK